MNSMPKYVASRTLTELTWNATLLEGDVVEAVRAVRAGPGGAILLAGSAALAQTLMPHGLIDEYRLLTFPVVLGTGKKFFADGAGPTTLELVDSRRFDGGAVLLTYRDPAVAS